MKDKPLHKKIDRLRIDQYGCVRDANGRPVVDGDIKLKIEEDE